uniref:Putative secreted protein n=1 Tax=Anopheles marajoara TaxID=58244 RepID=A0A2M4C896_9DIPT
MRNRGIEILSFAVFCSVSGLIENVTSFGGRSTTGRYWMMNCCVRWTLLARKLRLISHRSMYVMFTNTPWYVSYSVLGSFGQMSGNSNGNSLVPIGSLPDGARSLC